ncbi:hypothetical protein PENSPDRAFT_646163 [Peniophora sp. CONT]|nr:hypothetical protein PENSPDRAFT_646163 [Peniophora sp. CONT]
MAPFRLSLTRPGWPLQCVIPREFRENILGEMGLLRDGPEITNAALVPEGAMNSACYQTTTTATSAATASYLPTPPPETEPVKPGLPAMPIEWSWELEHEDRRRENKADASVHGAQPFLVDRRLLKDVVREKLECEVGRINFLSSGTFHKAYLVTLRDGREVIARVARRFMPRLKTESEVATMAYLRAHTKIPVPTVFFYDANPYNRLGGEYIIMSKAKGAPLSSVYQNLSHHQLTGLLDNLASLVIPLFAHRFPSIGSLYFGTDASEPPPTPSAFAPTIPTPTIPSTSFRPLTPSSNASSHGTTPRTNSSYFAHTQQQPAQAFHVGQIISWPFFGSNRGDLRHPVEIDRGPWTSTEEYFRACARREEQGVLRENEGTAAPHRLHLDPDEIYSSRHRHTNAVPEDKSDDSDEWDRDDSDDDVTDWPGDNMYRDYRRAQRTAFLISTLSQREQRLREEMARFIRVMHALGANSDPNGAPEEFGIDCHDLSLENIFVDPENPSKITCIIDWESTTIRPVWQCAHLPAFLQSSPFTARLFRTAVQKLAGPSTPRHPPRIPGLAMSSTTPASSSFSLGHLHPKDKSALAAEWLHWEAAGAFMRSAHRCIEWDGWEEGLVESIIGPEESEEEWIRSAHAETERALNGETSALTSGANSVPASGPASAPMQRSKLSRPIIVNTNGSSDDDDEALGPAGILKQVPGIVRRKSKKRSVHAPLHATTAEKEREKTLVGGGDDVELGRRLEALLTLHGNGDGSVRRKTVWEAEHEEEYEAGAE